MFPAKLLKNRPWKMMSLVSQAVQVKNPSRSKDYAALQKGEELLLTVECNNQLPRSLSPFTVPLGARKKNEGVLITLLYLITY